MNLRYFQFKKAIGGHANDGDDLFVRLNYQGQADLIQLLKDLGIEPRVFDERPPQPEPGLAYRGDEMQKFVSLVPGTRWVAQPGHTELSGIRVFVYGSTDHCSIHIVSEVDGGYGVGPADYAAAAQLEKTLLPQHAKRLTRPIA